MKYLIITQVFYPDTVSVSQHLSDLAFELAGRGNSVTVFTSIYPYEEKLKKYRSFEVIKGVKVYRLSQTAYGKRKTLFRILDYFSFYFRISLKLLCVRKYEFDVILGTTVPPLLSFIGVVIANWRRSKFVYWVMDLQPELSISSGLIKKNSLTAKYFMRLGNYVIKNSNRIVSLDRFMTEYLISRGASENNISTIPVWPVLDEVYTGDRLTNPFRVENKFGDRIVIMYSGNHAFVHPLNTLLEAALELRGDNRFLFVFVGGGVRKKDVTEFKNLNNLENILQLPFQPREQIHLSLGSADLQVVILGDGQVAFTHPNKVYGALYIGRPVLYIGPQRSHVSDIINTIEGNIAVEPGQVKVLVEKLSDFAKKSDNAIQEISSRNQKYAQDNLQPSILKQKMINAVV